MFTTEPGTVFGRPARVHLWPALKLDEADRRPHTTASARPLRCEEMDETYVYVLYASGHERMYVNGQPQAWNRLGMDRDVLYARARRYLIDAALGGRPVRGVTFLLGPCSRLGRGTWGDSWFRYPVVPAVSRTE
ncbi:hypothetical protein [Deinococcus aluminii]|uniref:Uncharacterized protein n=1 Tax=Deinococcus aluminii TaxID=1656885 RepID=A0ABP9XEU0_9DEIO